ncbi:hypothetical protein V1523DRAFT_381181 [Lipomyces doorenjongii]
MQKSASYKVIGLTLRHLWYIAMHFGVAIASIIRIQNISYIYYIALARGRFSIIGLIDISSPLSFCAAKWYDIRDKLADCAEIHRP